MASHRIIENEAKAVQVGRRAARNPLADAAPEITPVMLVGILSDGRVEGYQRGTVHRGTFYIECEGVQQYRDEPFLRVVMYGDEFHDKETRIPIATLAAAGFTYAPPAAEEAP